MSEEALSEAEDLETGVVRKIVETVDIKTDKLEEIHEKLDSLDKKMNSMENKLDKVITENTDESDLKDIHKRIINLLGNWMTTKNLAKIMNYRQEYISRKVSELKKMGIITEKRDGKSILYKRKDGVKEAMDDNGD